MRFKKGRYIAYKLIFWGLLFIPGYFLVQTAAEVIQLKRLEKEGIRVKGIVYEKPEATFTGVPKVYYTTKDGIFRENYLEGKSVTISFYQSGEEIELLYFEGKPNVVWDSRVNMLYRQPIQDISFILSLTAIFGSAAFMMIKISLMQDDTTAVEIGIAILAILGGVFYFSQQ